MSILASKEEIVKEELDVRELVLFSSRVFFNSSLIFLSSNTSFKESPSKEASVRYALIASLSNVVLSSVVVEGKESEVIRVFKSIFCLIISITL